ncbi:plasmid encoded RepA protein [Burkholderiales bacterium GJ-E10]|nr:plasmid encoded RepA protein [Burkholderiales bacterium GJ-E10]
MEPNSSQANRGELLKTENIRPPLDRVFVHPIMCQLGLPRSERGNELAFERRSGKATLRIEAGTLFDGEKFVQQPLPYGTWPRLFFAFLNTQALITKSPEIYVGTKRAFIRALGRNPNGGIRGSLAMFEKQVRATAASRIKLGWADGDLAHDFEDKPIKHFATWIGADGRHPTCRPHHVTLSDSYYELLLERTVPLDWNALQALDDSALAMDVYAWMAHRLCRLDSKVDLHWNSLFEQFGSEYQGKDSKKTFRTKFALAVAAALRQYPRAKVALTKEGLRLFPSPPPIAPKNFRGPT